MHQTTNGGPAGKNDRGQAKRHPVILRASTLVAGGVLSALLVSSVVPPIIADQSDRAVVNAPLTLLTAPIDGEVSSFSKQISNAVESGDSLARISNPRVDRSALIALEQKTSDARAKLEATGQKKDSDRAYLKALDSEISRQTQTLRAQFQSEIVALRARGGIGLPERGKKGPCRSPVHFGCPQRRKHGHAEPDEGAIFGGAPQRRR